MKVYNVVSIYEVFDNIKLYGDSSEYVIVACNIAHTEAQCLNDKVCSSTSVYYDVRKITANNIGEIVSVTCDKIEGYCE
jgi:hypothetical protein